MMGRDITVAFATLGCKLNQVESQEVQGLLESRGFRAVPFEGPAQICVINTCTVTGKADFSDRQMIRRAVARNPNAFIVVTGCYAQTDPGSIARIPGVDLIVGSQEKYRLADLLGSLEKRIEPEIRVGEIREARSIPVAPIASHSGRSRAFVKIQDGCQHRCAFCIVPYAKGGSRSQEPKVVLDQVYQWVESGYREVVLTGVDMGHYGWDLIPRTTLAALLGQIVEISGLKRLRLSSILPAYWSPELIGLVASSPIVCPHQHIPLQSGSDRVLRRMRRPYNTKMYRILVESLAERIPALGLGTDVIAGFPGESEEEFQETVNFIESLPLTYLHVFSYSPRKGTEAARLPDPVPAPVIRLRSEALRKLGRAKNLAFRTECVGTTMEALVLENRDKATGLLTGLTGNYLEVLFDGPDELMRSFVDVTITESRPDRALGRIAR
jgi:threonylcarbamoyladenosine tRNA methylthiotransferase MtaB